MNELRIRQVTEEDLEACAHIEASCFDPAEAAPRETVAQRIAMYPDGFLVAESADGLVGMINSAATGKNDISDEAFKKMIGHDPDGCNIVVFSLAVLPACQGAGIAKHLMQRFIETARRLEKRNILLLCKDHYVRFYEKRGFADRGLSRSQHGGARWHEMAMDLTR